MHGVAFELPRRIEATSGRALWEPLCAGWRSLAALVVHRMASARLGRLSAHLNPLAPLSSPCCIRHPHQDPHQDPLRQQAEAVGVGGAVAPAPPVVEPLTIELRGDALRDFVHPGTNPVSRRVTIRSLHPDDLVSALAFCRRLRWRDRWHYNPSEELVRMQVRYMGERFMSGGRIHLVLVERRAEQYGGVSRRPSLILPGAWHPL